MHSGLFLLLLFVLLIYLFSKELFALSFLFRSPHYSLLFVIIIVVVVVIVVVAPVFVPKIDKRR